MPYGLLLHVRPLQTISTQSRESRYRAEVIDSHSTDAALSLEFSGERFLNIFEKQIARDS